MKLRNKRTGEKAEVEINYNSMLVTHEDGRIVQYYFDSLKDLEEWEDYEEPKVGYIIDPMEEDYVSADDSGYEESDVERAKELGIWLETKEEAEKAVEKLKAWKRLKDKGFEIEGWDNNIGDDYYKTGQIVLNLNNVKNREWDEYDQIMEIKNDLDLLFGGEE